MTVRSPKQPRPKLMYVLGLAPTKIGGIEKFLRYFVQALDRAGWDAVLCFDGEIAPLFRDYIAGPSVTLESLTGQKDLGRAAAVHLWRLLRKYRPQVFVYAFHGVMRCFPWLARLAGARRIFFNDHSSRPPGQAPAPLALPKRIAGRILTAPLTGILSVSQFTRSSGNVLGLTSVKSTVVLNGIEILAADDQRGEDFRKRYNILGESIVIAQVCWMVDVKGVDTLLRAAALLNPTHPQVRLLCVGDGPRIEEYRALATELGLQDIVIFTGVLNNPTESGLYDAIDIYTQLSVWQEASGLAVLEAMAANKPVVATNIGALPEIVHPGSSGLLVPVADPEATREAVERLVTDAALRARMGAAGFETVVSRHRIENTAAQYVRVFLGATEA